MTGTDIRFIVALPIKSVILNLICGTEYYLLVHIIEPFQEKKIHLYFRNMFTSGIR